MGKDKSAKKKMARDSSAFVRPYRVSDPEDFRLRVVSTDDKGGLDKEQAQKVLDLNRERMNDLQERLYAEDRWSVLLIFQGMDAAGKDSAIEHVMHGINPQGCDVHTFKVPTSKELDHDFLWRSTIALPERGTSRRSW
jgi:polyphosphate kinase 2 (PPK2 family)